MTLSGYYVEKASEDTDSLVGSDNWAIKYINIGRAQNILEAFDDDTSGFVTTNEVNNFTRSRPAGWRCSLSLKYTILSIDLGRSLPHWIAWWAIGIHTHTFEVRRLTSF